MPMVHRREAVNYQLGYASSRQRNKAIHHEIPAVDLVADTRNSHHAVLTASPTLGYPHSTGITYFTIGYPF
jgi:hypothetical protein